MGRVAMVMACLVLSCLSFKKASGVEYTVGDAGGWTTGVGGWTQGKKFKPGDVLIFNYEPALHNVVWVDLDSYNTCSIKANSLFYVSGHDRVVLPEGRSFFFSNKNKDCDNKVKIEVQV